MGERLRPLEGINLRRRVRIRSPRRFTVVRLLEVVTELIGSIGNARRATRSRGGRPTRWTITIVYRRRSKRLVDGAPCCRRIYGDNKPLDACSLSVRPDERARADVIESRAHRVTSTALVWLVRPAHGHNMSSSSWRVQLVPVTVTVTTRRRPGACKIVLVFF